MGDKGIPIWPVLTDRQYEAVRLRARGHSIRETAMIMGISENGTGKLIQHAKERFEVDSFIDLITVMGWLKVPE